MPRVPFRASSGRCRAFVKPLCRACELAPLCGDRGPGDTALRALQGTDEFLDTTGCGVPRCSRLSGSGRCAALIRG